MALVPKIDPNKIFASNAPTQDKPAAFDNYEKGMDETRKNLGRPTIKQSNYLHQTADQKVLWIHQNGAALPYDPSIEYAEKSVTLKDGELKQLVDGAWVEVKTKSLTATSITTASSQTQQVINDFGGAKWYAKVGGYELGATVKLDNGDTVQSTAPSNTVNPNVDMTGWKKPTVDKDYVDKTYVSKVVSAAADGVIPFLTQTDLLLAKPTQVKVLAKAMDSRKEYLWNRTSAEGLVPVTGTWTDTGLSDLDQAKNYTDQEAQDLFKQQNPLKLQSNMTVRRYSAADTSNDYAAGTYQTQVGQSVQLDVVASGSNATKHFYLTSLAPQNFEAEFKVTLQNFGGDAVGVGFKTGNNFEIIAFSNSGNLSRISNYTLSTLQSGLGGYVLGDTVKFKYDGAKISVYVNDVKKGEATTTAGDAVCFGQMGFSRYLVQLNGKAVDPIREYVAQELSKIPAPDPTVLPQAKSYTESYVEDQSIDLFKKTVSIPYLNNMTVTRFTAVGTSNDYAAGTYQSLAGDKVNLTVPSGGSNAIKHYFVSAINAQDLSVEIKVTKQNFSGDSVGIGLKDGANFNLVAFSNSGNLSTISGFTNTLVTSGLGGYGVGDTVKFDLSGSTVKVYVNGAFKAQQTLSSTAGVLIIGQLGFSQYESSIVGKSIDPIRDYVKTEIAEVAKGVFSKCYYSFEVGVAPLLGTFKAFTQVKGDLYVGFEVKHEYNMTDIVYQDYWRIFQALFYKFTDGIMQPTSKTALGIGESEFVLKTNSTKVDFTGGYHGDEIVSDVKFLADGLLIGTTANIPLTACEQFEYIEKSTMHETADANGFIAGHPKIADHLKHTVFKNAGYKSVNKCTWNYAGLMTLIYHGIACIHKDVATTVFSDDSYTDQTMTGSGNNYFNAVGARLYKGRNQTNGLAAEAAAYQVTPNDKDALSEFFVHDRSTDSKYYRKTPASTVAVGEKHESHFECKFLAL